MHFKLTQNGNSGGPFCIQTNSIELCNEGVEGKFYDRLNKEVMSFTKASKVGKL